MREQERVTTPGAPANDAVIPPRSWLQRYRQNGRSRACLERENATKSVHEFGTVGIGVQVQPKHDNNFNLIRLAAALQVLLVHAANHFGYAGWFVDALKIVPGVPTFFFISGFLIFTSYDRMRSKSIYGFFINRVLRIYPALLVCVCLSVLGVYLTGYFSGREVGIAQFVVWILGQITFFQFYNPDFMREFGVGVLNGALWTITVELQFYLLVPILYYLIRQRARIAALVLVVSLCLNLLIREYLNWDLLYTKLVYVSFAPWLYMFLLGSIAASLGKVRSLVDRIEFKYLLLAYIVSMNFIGTYSSNASNAINPISFAILALLIMKSATTKLCIPVRLKRYVERADFSYGLYLYHMPVINLLLVLGWFSGIANMALTIVCSCLLAIFSWYAIERPALSHKR